MCIICPPLWSTLWLIRETRARLTPAWTARRQTDEIIRRDRKLIREYERQLQDSACPPRDIDRHAGFSVTLNNGFYYVWFRGSRAMEIDLCHPTCSPLMLIDPDYIVLKSKLRRDQIEYMEHKCRIIHD